MSAAEVVQQVRAAAGLSVRSLAASAGVSASTVHRIETGAIDPTLSTLVKVVSGAGARLVVSAAPDPSSSVLALGVWLAGRSDRDDHSWPVRHAAELAGRVLAADPEDRGAMIAAAPPATGDVRWDGFLAALADWIAITHRLPRPAWVAEPDRALDEGWWVTPMESMRAWEYAGSPASFRHRGIYLHRDSLTNV